MRRVEEETSSRSFEWFQIDAPDTTLDDRPYLYPMVIGEFHFRVLLNNDGIFLVSVVNAQFLFVCFYLGIAIDGLSRSNQN